MKTFGALGMALSFFDIIDTARRAEQSGKTFQQQYIDDLIGSAHQSEL